MLKATGLSESFPIYTTRKSGGGETMTYSQTYWMTALAQLLIWFNIVIWGGIGIYEAVRLVLL